MADTTLAKWAATCSNAVKAFYDVTVTGIEESPSNSSEVKFVLSQLALSCQFTSESLLILVENGRLWDAEILDRSLAEGTIRFCFISLGSPDEQKEKANEFWNVAPEAMRLSEHRKVEEFFSVLDDPDASEWTPLKELLLTAEQVLELQRKFPSKIRQPLEQRWSFGELIRIIAKSGVPALDGLVALAHGFAMSSHLVHKDGASLGLIWDRLRRDEVRRKSLEYAHACRELTDTLAFAMFRAHMATTQGKSLAKSVKQIMDHHEPFLEELNKARITWHQIEYADSDGPSN